MLDGLFKSICGQTGRNEPQLGAAHIALGSLLLYAVIILTFGIFIVLA